MFASDQRYFCGCMDVVDACQVPWLIAMLHTFLITGSRVQHVQDVQHEGLLTRRSSSEFR
jgi:hypothetical protein